MLQALEQQKHDLLEDSVRKSILDSSSRIMSQFEEEDKPEEKFDLMKKKLEEKVETIK